MKVKIKKLTDNCIIPTKATKGSACYDLYLPTDVLIKRGRNIVYLDFAIELEKGTYAEIRPRSGFSSKGMEGRFGFRLNADVLHGIVDEDYRGCVGVTISNNDNPFYLDKGTRIAQMLIAKYEDVDFEEIDELTETDRVGGFGSTGSK